MQKQGRFIANKRRRELQLQISSNIELQKLKYTFFALFLCHTSQKQIYKLYLPKPFSHLVNWFCMAESESGVIGSFGAYTMC